MSHYHRYQHRYDKRQKKNPLLRRQAAEAHTETLQPDPYSLENILSALGNANVQHLLSGIGIQTKQELSTPGDFLEQQADQFASGIMHSPSTPSSTLLDSVQVQRKSGNPAPAGMQQALTNLQGEGHPLSRPVCDFLTPRMGVELGHIRVHTDDKAARMAESIHARAFTYGNDIAFAHNAYQPGSLEGRKLIAHEVAHVFQQSGGIQRKEQLQSGGTPVNKAGIVYRNVVNLRSLPDTSTAGNILRQLSFNTVLLILDRYSNGWSFVRTQEGEEGYVASDYLKDNLPEPNARLHLITPGESAIGIAEHYYKAEAQDWGQDLRYFVNVLVHVNRGAGDFTQGISMETGEESWKNARVRSGYYIWIPSVEFARQLVGQVKSGSLSYEFISGLSPKMADFILAFQLSGQYIPGAIKEVIVDPFIENIVSIAIFMTTFLGLTMLFNFIGGVGGAIALLVLNLIGLGFMVTLLAGTLWSLGGALIDFFKKVWSADGDREIIEEGAKDFARAIALLLKAIIEGLLAYLAAQGVAGAYKNLMGTKFGQWFGLTKLNQWLQKGGLRTGAGQYTFDMVNNPGPLASLRGNPAANFAGGKYNMSTLNSDLILYRGGKAGGGPNAYGRWFTRTPPESVAQVRIDSAVKPQWIEPSTGVLQSSSPIEAVYAIKYPAGTVIYEGPVASQGGIYLGGQNCLQIFIQTPNAPGVVVLSETPIF